MTLCSNKKCTMFISFFLGAKLLYDCVFHSVTHLLNHTTYFLTFFFVYLLLFKIMVTELSLCKKNSGLNFFMLTLRFVVLYCRLSFCLPVFMSVYLVVSLPICVFVYLPLSLFVNYFVPMDSMSLINRF